MLLAKEQPRLAFGVRRAALLHERAKRRDAGSGANHNNRHVLIGRGQAEFVVGRDEARNRRGFRQCAQPSSPKPRPDASGQNFRIAPSPPSNAPIRGTPPRLDEIEYKSHLQLAQKFDELGGGEINFGVFDQQINDFAAPQILRQLDFFVGIEQMRETTNAAQSRRWL